MAKWYKMSNGNLGRKHDSAEEVKKELQEVADALGLPITDGNVVAAWCAAGNRYNDEVAEKVILPMYYENKNN